MKTKLHNHFARQDGNHFVFNDCFLPGDYRKPFALFVHDKKYDYLFLKLETRTNVLSNHFIESNLYKESELSLVSKVSGLKWFMTFFAWKEIKEE